MCSVYAAAAALRVSRARITGPPHDDGPAPTPCCLRISDTGCAISAEPSTIAVGGQAAVAAQAPPDDPPATPPPSRIKRPATVRPRKTRRGWATQSSMTVKAEFRPFLVA